MHDRGLHLDIVVDGDRIDDSWLSRSAPPKSIYTMVLGVRVSVIRRTRYVTETGDGTYYRWESLPLKTLTRDMLDRYNADQPTAARILTFIRDIIL